jgi:pyrrolidone-carboxylate peptidase
MMKAPPSLLLSGFEPFGQYVCESIFWTLLDYAATQSPGMHAGFLHVPAISDVWPAQRAVEVVWELVKGIGPSRGDAVHRQCRDR